MADSVLLLVLTAIKKVAGCQPDPTKALADVVDLLDSVIVELKRQTPAKETAK